MLGDVDLMLDLEDMLLCFVCLLIVYYCSLTSCHSGEPCLLAATLPGPAEPRCQIQRQRNNSQHQRAVVNTTRWQTNTHNMLNCQQGSQFYLAIHSLMVYFTKKHDWYDKLGEGDISHPLFYSNKRPLINISHNI